MKEDTTPTRWSDAFLDEMRLNADPLADDTIAQIMAAGDREVVNTIFKSLRTNAALDRKNLPKVLQDFFEKASQLPSWADPELLKKGAEYFGSHALEFSMLLSFVSLPLAYSSARGAQVLATTGRLEEGKDGNLEKFTRRLMETAQFVFNVGMPGGFQANGVAIESAMKVRLMHAIIRYYIKAHGPWDVAKYGEPINQEDLTGTMLSFSSLIYDGMDEMGIKPENELRAAHFHTWRVVGHLMGISPEMMPKEMKEGNALGWQILRRNRQTSQAGKDLTRALIDFNKKAIPGTLFNHLPEVFIQYFCGRKIGAMLGVKSYGWFWEKFVPFFMVLFLRDLDSATHVTKFVAKIAARIQRKFLQHTINEYYGYKKIEFQLPESLRSLHNLRLGAENQDN
ncbi:MAG TPA: DUF2236 domain-containing protein [Bacteroidetes bacterium]|nr:DUF2236 domain-containing protein [Bacteroidota bacterium]